MKKQIKQLDGFALADIVIVSLVVMFTLSGLLSISTSSFRNMHIDYYQTLAEEAAEAGTAYATSCLSETNGSQTWGSKKGQPDLTPSSDCDGTEDPYSTNKYVYSSGKIRTRFTVPNLDFETEYSVQISSIGYTEIVDSRGTVKKTYKSILKKVITWEGNVFKASQMASNGYGNCTILSNQIYCWGDDYISSNYATSLKKPAKFKHEGSLAGKTIKQISIGIYFDGKFHFLNLRGHSCALTNDNKVHCWGKNNRGQLGNGNTTDSEAPVEVTGLPAGKTITQIVAASESTCVIASGEVYCWGNNYYGQIGDGSTDQMKLSPTKTKLVGQATKLSGNDTTICAIVNSRAWCWGSNYEGKAGVKYDYSGRPIRTPAKVYDSGVLKNKNVTDISSGTFHTCAVAEKRVYCWGYNQWGQLGNNSTAMHYYLDSYKPVAVDTSGVLKNKDISEVQVGSRHTCTRSGNDIFCWGLRQRGQLGDGKTTPEISSIPVAVLKEPGKLQNAWIKTLVSGDFHSCALTMDGKIFCWGDNWRGGIGDGTESDRPKPTEVILPRTAPQQYIY